MGNYWKRGRYTRFSRELLLGSLHDTLPEVFRCFYCEEELSHAMCNSLPTNLFLSIPYMENNAIILLSTAMNLRSLPRTPISHSVICNKICQNCSTLELAVHDTLYLVNHTVSRTSNTPISSIPDHRPPFQKLPRGKICDPGKH
jgi:hypothetical protein